jgi:plasmid maintenance system antidote protein VapI
MPRMADESKKRLLQYALGRVGRKELAARLKVPEKMVEEWLQGSADMTHNKALALADLVHQLTRGGT